MLSPEDLASCLEMFRRFAADGFDRDFVAIKWLFAHKHIAEEFIVEYLDLLTPAERSWTYTFMEGMFRKSFKRLLESRLQAERDAACREELLRIREWSMVPPPSRAELMDQLESDLRDKSPILRCLAAMDLFDLTGQDERVVPVLLAILRDQSSEAREFAAATLGELKVLNQEARRELRAIASNSNDPARAAAQTALNAHKSRRGLLQWFQRKRR